MTALALTDRPGAVVATSEPRDLATLTDQEFDAALQRLDVRKMRVAKILDHYLVQGAHFGIPEKSGFKKPILYRAGAEELRVGFGLEVLRDGDDTITESAEYVAVTVRRAIADRAGRILQRAVASCTSKERRFKSKDGSGWTYQDAREVLNDVYAMAEKRAASRLTVAALGLTAWLANEEEIAASIDEQDAEDARPITRWTDAEKKSVFDAAKAKGMTKGDIRRLVNDTLGREEVGSGDDVKRLLEAIAAWQRPATDSASPSPAASAPTVAPEAAPAPAPAGTDASADVEYHDTKPEPTQSETLFGKGNFGPVLPGEVEISQSLAGELPLGESAARRRKNAVAEGA